MWWRRRQQDFNAQVEAHIELEADRLRAEGMAPEDARAAALRAFGNRGLAEEQFYESRRWMLLDNMVRDIRFAIRVLTKDARFSVLAILGLALGIGLSTTIFTLINTAIHIRAAAGETDLAYVVRGGAFTASDRERGAPVAMVDQELARRCWPEENPLGKRIRFSTAGTTFFEVVGVAPDFEDSNSVNRIRPLRAGQAFLRRSHDRSAGISNPNPRARERESCRSEGSFAAGSRVSRSFIAGQ